MGLQTVYVYRVPNQQLANRQYVMQPSSTLLSTNTNIKVTGNYYQEIHLPFSSSNDTANMVKINGYYYDIISIDHTTFKESSTIYKIALNPVSTFITATTVYGTWDRTPSNVRCYNSFSIGEDDLYRSRFIEVPYIANVASTASLHPMFIHLTAKYDIVTASESQLCEYGWFAPYGDGVMTSGVASYSHYYYSGSKYYPNIPNTINDIDTITGIPSDTIVDVSISRRCPYSYETYSTTGLKLKNTVGTAIAPIDVTGNYGIYKLSGTDIGLPTLATVTGTLTDLERYAGEAWICDEMGNRLVKIPSEHCNSSGTFFLYCTPYCDVTGLYLDIRLSNEHITIPEGKLPWVGDAWADYMARTYQYDREMLANNIKYAKEQKNLDTQNAVASGVMNTAFAGGMGAMTNPAGAAVGVAAGVASTALNVYTINEQTKLGIRELKSTQKAKEGLMKNSVSNNYQTAYGLDYCYRGYAGDGCGVKVFVPKNLDANDFTDYIDYYGWPCGGYASFTLSAGYIKGNMHSMPATVGNGYEMNMLKKEIADGCRILTS